MKEEGRKCTAFLPAHAGVKDIEEGHTLLPVKLPHAGKEIFSCTFSHPINRRETLLNKGCLFQTLPRSAASLGGNRMYVSVRTYSF